MTTFGWDASHYDGTLTSAVLKSAKAEGIELFTHKLGEGISNTDPTAGTALAAARDAGIPLLGGYWFIHGNDSPAAEVGAMLAQLNAKEPWWRTFPGFFIQCDAERSPTGLPSPAYVKEWCDVAARATARVVVCYASHGMYGDNLKGLGHPLWNANYGANKAGAFKSVYPGDSFAGWTAYSGQTPTLCQFSSEATIAGRTTCDANAFRGTLAQLTKLIAPAVPTPDPNGGNPVAHDPLDATDLTDIWHSPQLADVNGVSNKVSAAGGIEATRNAALAMSATLAGIVKTEAAIQATLATLTAGGGNVDTAALATQIKAVGDAESAAVAALQKQVAAIDAENVSLKSALAAAAQGSAAALAK